MNVGLVIGKFLPPHRGHIALIEFALKRCDKLIVLVHIKKSDYIDGTRRVIWLYEIFDSNPKITIDYSNDETLPESSVSDVEVSRVWASYLTKRFPQVRTIFSSEEYGNYLAKFMDIKHIIFDKDRARYNISATKIRENPYSNWVFIPEKIREHFIKKVCIYGPESTGKSTLTEKLAKHYNTEFVPEVAREIIGDDKVTISHIKKIYQAHANEILTKTKSANKILFVDTDYLTTSIYSRFYFKKVPSYPIWVKYANKFDLYLFCDIDTPWYNDPQRHTQDIREESKGWFIEELDKNGIPYKMINGNWEERFKIAVEYVEELI